MFNIKINKIFVGSIAHGVIKHDTLILWLIRLSDRLSNDISMIYKVPSSLLIPDIRQVYCLALASRIHVMQIRKKYRNKTLSGIIGRGGGGSSMKYWIKRGGLLAIFRPKEGGPGKKFHLSKYFSLPPLYINDDRSLTSSQKLRVRPAVNWQISLYLMIHISRNGCSSQPCPLGSFSGDRWGRSGIRRWYLSWEVSCSWGVSQNK